MTDAIAPRVPRIKENDYTPEMAAERRAFAEKVCGAALHHVGAASFDPSILPGNIESYFGVAQVPMGLAGPLRINGEHAKGDFYVPLATTEGTLVASYSRGMRLLSEAGGVKTTVVERYMQRAPVFHFSDAREARDFSAWVDAHMDGVRAAAEATTSVGKLSHVQRFNVAQMCFLRFNYTTGDAAGQNLCGKATLAACEWIRENAPGAPRFTLSGAIDTDKKHSHMNMLHSRGARVVAEAVIPDERSEIAAVFNRRLAEAIPLGADPTVEYGLGVTQTPERPLTLAQVNTPSPYNTYINVGLPPTPIANPGLPSLEASLAPPPTEYLYFVARYDGTHVFSRTLAEHEAAQARIRDAIDAGNPTAD